MAFIVVHALPVASLGQGTLTHRHHDGADAGRVGQHLVPWLHAPMGCEYSKTIDQILIMYVLEGYDID